MRGEKHGTRMLGYMAKTSEQDGFDYREHPCTDRKAARVEAQRQQAIESDRDAAWVAVKTRGGQWVARRVPVGSEEETKTFWESLVGALLMFPWF
jgi:hypothetical protein